MIFNIVTACLKSSWRWGVGDPPKLHHSINLVWLNNEAVLENQLKRQVHECTRVSKGVQGCTSVYKGVQGCTRVYKGVQWCTRVYKSVQGGTRVFKGVQGCTRVYKGVQGCTRVYKSVQECTSVYKRFGMKKYPKMTLWSSKSIHWIKSYCVISV